MLQALRSAKFPVALTGAGISAPSGIPTYQSTWKGRPIRDFLGRDYFRHNLMGFLALYSQMVAWCDAAPNAAHLALAAHRVPVITQNIDGLHQKAGSKAVVELHGNLRRVVCTGCGRAFAAAEVCRTLGPLLEAGNRDAVSRAFRCPCGGPLDVDVVLYGDAVREMPRAMELLDECDLLLVIGTSLETYPAAGLPDIARRRGVRVLYENSDCIAALTDEVTNEEV